MAVGISTEKRELIKKVQDAIGRSPKKLAILKHINKKLSVDELKDKLKIPQSTVSQAIARFESYNLILFVKKKDNSKVFDKVPLLKQMGSLDKLIKMQIDENADEIPPRRIRIKPKAISGVPFIDFKVQSEAEKMACGPYVTLYLLENSIRKFINSVMIKKYGKDWWQKVVKSSDILDRVSSRKKLEEIHQWHVPRGEHEIFYTNLEDLSYFLNVERKEFGKYLGDVDLWMSKINKEIKLSRNIIDHHNPLPTREINRLNEMLEDWKRQIKT